MGEMLILLIYRFNPSSLPTYDLDLVERRAVTGRYEFDEDSDSEESDIDVSGILPPKLTDRQLEILSKLLSISS